MTKFTPLPDEPSSSSSSASDCCESPSLSSEDSTRSHDKSSAVAYHDESSFSIPDISSVCEDSEAFALALVDRTASASNSNTDVGSTVFQNFLLCFDERDQRSNSHSNPTALLKASSSSSSSNYQQFRQLIPKQRVIRVRSADSNSSKIVSLPQFLWQPDGLCCHAENVSMEMQNELNDGLILFEEPAYDDDDDEDDDDDKNNHQDDDDLGAIRGDQSQDQDDYPLLQAAMEEEQRDPAAGRPRSSSLGNTNDNGGGTADDPRYVPRPSSTTPGLREMSRLFHTSSLPEDKLSKKYSMPWAAHQEEEEDTALRPAAAGAVVTPPRNALQASQLIAAAPALKLTKSSSTPPVRQKRMHRRTRSEDKSTTSRTNSNVVSVSPPLAAAAAAAGLFGGGGGNTTTSTGRSGLPPRHRRTPSESSGQGSENGGDNSNRKGVILKKNPMKSLFRRSKKLPSFRKPKFHPLGSPTTKSNSNSEPNQESSDDVANILASLEATHQEQQKGNNRSKKSRNRGSSSSPTKSLLEENRPLSPQSSGETHSDTSSLEDIFGNVEDYDDFDDCYSESSQESRSMERRLFAAPCSDKFNASKTPFYQQQQYGRQHYSSLKDHGDRKAMLSSKTELLRCGSTATAKASNLTYDPVADRAKLLELQVVLNQTQKEEQQRLNAPPIDFEAPGGDNVIRVRDAMCEIEVLPKSDLGLSGMAPPTAAEF